MSDFSNYECILLVGLVFYIQAHIMMEGLEERWKSGGNERTALVDDACGEEWSVLGTTPTHSQLDHM